MEEEQIFDLQQPEPIEVPAVTEPEKKPKKKLITISQAERAARDAGFAVVSPRHLEKVATLGEFAEQIGVIPLNRGKIAMAQSHMEQLLTECRTRRARLANAGAEDEAYVALVSAEQKVLSSYIESAALSLKVVRVELKDEKPEPPAHRSWIPGQIVTPVQLNVTNVTNPPPANNIASDPDKE